MCVLARFGWLHLQLPVTVFPPLVFDWASFDESIERFDDEVFSKETIMHKPKIAQFSTWFREKHKLI